jgi:hypothetical protein
MRAIIVLLCAVSIILTLASRVRATEPAQSGEFPNNEFADKLRHFTTKRGFLNLTKAVVANRVAVFSGALTSEAAEQRGGTSIKGHRSIPVIMSPTDSFLSMERCCLGSRSRMQHLIMRDPYRI